MEYSEYLKALKKRFPKGLYKFKDPITIGDSRLDGVIVGHSISTLGEFLSNLRLLGASKAIISPANAISKTKIRPVDLGDSTSNEMSKERDYYLFFPLYHHKTADKGLLEKELKECWKHFTAQKRALFGKNGGYAVIMPVFLLDNMEPGIVKYIEGFGSKISLKFFCYPILVDLNSGEPYYRKNRRLWGYSLYPKFMEIAGHFFGKNEEKYGNIEPLFA
jgi:hypothetical protein